MTGFKIFMNNFIKYISRLSAWFYICGSLVFFIGHFFLESWTGIFIFLIGCVGFIGDPVWTLFQKARSRQSIRSYLLVYGFGLVAIISFFTRQWMEISINDFADGEEALLPRFRLMLLFVFVFSFAATIVSRFMVFLSEASARYGSESHQSQRKGYFQNAFFSILAVLVLLLAVNYITTLRNPVIDLKGNLSFGDQATTIISSIENDVKVSVFLPEVQNVKTRGKTGTNELFRISEDIRVIMEQLPVINSRIDLEFLNADLTSFESNEYGTVNNGTIIVRKYRDTLVSENEKPYIERRVYIYTQKDMKKIEKEVTRALVYVSSKKVNVYFASSNGENFNPPQGQNDQSGIELFKNQLRFFNATLRKLDHTNKWPGPVPEDCDILFLMGPTVPYGSLAQNAIREYIKKGGNVFVALTPAGKESLSWLFESFGGNSYKYSREIIFNTRLNAVALTDSTGSHRITDSFTGTKRPPVVLLNNGYFEAVKKTRPVQDNQQKQKKQKTKSGIKFESLSQLMPVEILFSMHNSHVDRNKNTLPDKNEQIGRKPLAIAFEQKGNPDSPRIVVYSGVGYLSNQAMNFPVVNSNLQIALDSMHWMTENPLIAGLVPEESQSKTIQLTDAIKTRLLFLGVVVFPLSLSGAVALMIALYRRKRKFIEAD